MKSPNVRIRMEFTVGSFQREMPNPWPEDPQGQEKVEVPLTELCVATLPVFNIIRAELSPGGIPTFFFELGESSRIFDMLSQCADQRIHGWEYAD